MAMFRFAAHAFLIMATTATLAASSYIHPSTIGTPGQPWGIAERTRWRDTREKQRCYTEVVTQITNLGDVECQRTSEKLFDVVQYGSLPHEGDEDGASFPLFAVKSRNWNEDKPSILITGGVHGYETSGVQGAILFVNAKASRYVDRFNIAVAPCVSPWGYERIQRWNARGVDPNRSFNPNGEVVEGRSFNPEAATRESAALIAFLEGLGVEDWLCHVDLHETTDSDETEFRPAKDARDGVVGGEAGEIPDGFYLVQDETSPMEEWFAAMIESVRKVTHIAPADSEGKLIGEAISQEGVIAIPNKTSLGLCAGVTNAPYRTTTEVYPDSPNATPEQCNDAQVACIVGALDHIISVL